MSDYRVLQNVCAQNQRLCKEYYINGTKMISTIAYAVYVTYGVSSRNLYTGHFDIAVGFSTLTFFLRRSRYIVVLETL